MQSKGKYHQIIQVVIVLISVVLLPLLWSVERCLENSCHAIYLLPISIFIVVVVFALHRRHLSPCIRAPLFTGIVLILVLGGFPAQTTAEGREPERIVIASGDNFEPLIFLNVDGEPEGMWVDRWRLWSEKTGVEVDLRLMNWTNTIPALLAGEVDAVDGVSYTPERAKVLDLSASYTEIPSHVYFHESIGGVRGLADLEGFPVGVIGGSHVENHLRTKAPKLRPVPYINYEEIVQAAIQDRLRVFVGEDPMIPFLFAKMGHRITFRRTEAPIISSDMRTAVRKGETELLSLIERGHKAITPAEWQGIRDEWAGVSLTSRIPWRWLIGGVAILLTGVALLLLWNTHLQKRVASATRTLSESEERLRSFAKALPDLAFIIDEDGRYLEILTAEEGLLYKDLPDLKNHQMHEVLPKEVADLSLEVIGKTIATEKIQVFEYMLDMPTGQHWFEARLSPMLGIFRDKRMVTCISRDISERKQMEETLQASEARYRSIVEDQTEFIIRWLPDGTITFANKAYCDYFAIAENECVGTNFFPLIHEEDRAAVKEKIASLTVSNPVSTDEHRVIRFGDKIAWNQMVDRAIFNAEEQVIEFQSVGRDVTERKRMEEALQMSEKLYRSLFENTGTATFVVEEDMTISQINSRSAELSGYSKHEIEKKLKTTQFVAKEDLERIQQYHWGRRNADGDYPSEYEVRLVTKHGEVKNVIIQVGMIPGTKKTINSITDITARREAEAKLKLNEERYRLLVETMSDSLVVLDANGFVTYANDQTCQMWGNARDDILGQPFTHFLDEANQLIFNQELKKRKKGGHGSYKLTFTPEDGKKISTIVSPKPILDADGRFAGSFAVITDITGLMRAESSLRESESRYRALFESANDAIFIMKGDVFMDCNQKTLEMFDCTREQIIGKQPAPFSPINQPDGSVSQEKAMEKIKAAYTGEPQIFEWKHTTFNGTPFDAQVSLNRVELSTGMHVQAIVRDISEQINAEKDKKILESQLIQAQKMEAIGTLAGGIAHDFNNILSAIIGFTEISIREVPPGSKLEDNLQRVFNAGIRARDLVKQILTFSRQTDREINLVHIETIVKEALKLIRASLPTTIEIKQDLGSESLILGDPTQVHQIIMNLCTNASHSMQERGGKLNVSLSDVELGADVTNTHPEMAPGPYIKLSVSDSGHGITPEIKDRIFHPYFTTKEKGQGTGLGLSVVHGIVKDCGGMVSVESTPGKGSTFHVFFPAVESEQNAEIVSHTSLPTGNERILFVDDEEYQVEMGKQILVYLGYSVTTKTSSLEALEVFRAKPDAFDLVITDMTMPKMAGDLLAKEIMTIRSDMPIILCTGYSEKITPAKAKILGIKEVLMKPAVVEEIARTVRMVLDQTIKD